MKKRFFVVFINLLVLFSLIVPPVFAYDDFIFRPNYLASDEQMTDESGMTKEEVQAFLSRGALSHFRTQDVNGFVLPAVDIIMNVSETFHINPKFLLVLLQREQSLVEDPTPSQDQLDWAMGYAVCDSCSKYDPMIQKYRGFGNQVYYAAQRIRESYLFDLETKGKTISGIGPGNATVIDGVMIVPENFATAALYSYTPHIHGNQNFVAIWERWFSRDFPSGSLLQDKETGGVWLIQNGKKRAIQSKAVLLSRFNLNAMLTVDSETIDQYDMGAPIHFPNYSLLRSPKGTVYLIVDDTKRGFSSQESFRASGFSSDEIVDVSFADLDNYAEGESISTASVYPQGVLLQDVKSGGIFSVENGKKHSVMSREILSVHFANQPIQKASTKELNTYKLSDPVLFPDGTLVGVKGSPDIFVIENGLRRHVADEATFETYGWSLKQIVWTNERSVLLHPLGDEISNTLPDSLIQTSSIK